MLTKTEPILVKIVDAELTDRNECIESFLVESGHTFQAFYWDNNFFSGEERLISMEQLSLHFDWVTVFRENVAREIKLEKGPGQCEYFGFGQLIQIRPIVADFGVFKLELGDWTNDERVIGEFIYWRIDQLRIS